MTLRAARSYCPAHAGPPTRSRTLHADLDPSSSRRAHALLLDSAELFLPGGLPSGTYRASSPARRPLPPTVISPLTSRISPRMAAGNVDVPDPGRP